MESTVTLLYLSLASFGWTEQVSTSGNTTGAEKDNCSNGHEKIHVVQYNSAAEDPVLFAVFVIVACFAKLLFHLSKRLTNVVPESVLLISLGLILGGIFFKTQLAQLQFTSNLFFLYLLPPIVLESGYFIKTAAFFGNSETIILYAIVGTLFNTFTLGLSLYGVCIWGWVPGMKDLRLVDALFFASLTSAVDPVAVLAVFEEIHVNELLHILVLGESILNDAISIVLYRVFEVLSEKKDVTATDVGLGVASFFTVSFGALAIGIVLGIVASLMTRFSNHVSAIQPILIVSMGYVAYLLADLLHWSGIVSGMFCAMLLRRYAAQNIEDHSQTAVKFIFKNLSLISEAVIFVFLGLHTVNSNDHEWNTAFVGFTLLFVLVYRFIGTYLLSALANTWSRRRIEPVDQFTIAYGGLRGAVSFSLVIIISDCFQFKKVFFTTTVAVVFFTVFVLGVTIKPLVKRLHVSLMAKKRLTVGKQVTERVLSHAVAAVEEITGTHGWYWLKEVFENFSAKYVGRLLLRKNEYADQEIVKVYIKEQYRGVEQKINRCRRKCSLPTLDTSDSDSDSDKKSGSGRRRGFFGRRSDSASEGRQRKSTMLTSPDVLQNVLYSPLVAVHEFFRTGPSRNNPSVERREIETKLAEVRRRRLRRQIGHEPSTNHWAMPGQTLVNLTMGIAAEPNRRQEYKSIQETSV